MIGVSVLKGTFSVLLDTETLIIPGKGR